MPDAPAGSGPLVQPLPDDGALTTRLLAPNWTPSRAWWPLFLASGALTALFLVAIAVTLVRGIGA